MNDEYIYQYPAPEYMENFKEMVAQRTTNTNGARKKVIVCFGISMAFLVLYCLPFLNFIDTYLLLVAVIFLCATVILLKGITKNLHENGDYKLDEKTAEKLFMSEQPAKVSPNAETLDLSF